MLVTMSCIVFLNFIISEVTSSYNKVKDKLKDLENKERLSLIKESEDMLNIQKIRNNPKIFPKYLITRKIDSM